MVGKDIVNGTFNLVKWEKCDSGIGLWVQVNQQRPFLFLGQSGGEINGGRRFANPTFLVGDRNDRSRCVCHWFLVAGVSNLIRQWAGPGASQCVGQKPVLPTTPRNKYTT